MLDIPRTNRVTYGDRAFSIYASKLWNKLPSELKNKFQEEAENTLIQFGLWIDNKPMEHISVILCTVLLGFNK